MRILYDEKHRGDLRREEQPFGQRTDDEFLAPWSGEIEGREGVADVEREELGINRSYITWVFTVSLDNRAELLRALNRIVGG